MAKLILILAAQILLLAAVASTGEFARTMNEKHLGLPKQEKLTHLRFFWHDSVTSLNSRSVRIHQQVSKSSLFGQVTMMDDPLTLDVARNSTVVGQAQGIYAGGAQREISYLMVMNFAFTSGKYNGSTIVILGRNRVRLEARVMPVVGGSGTFRFARGYAKARTKSLDVNSGAVTLEFSCCYASHY